MRKQILLAAASALFLTGTAFAQTKKKAAPAKTAPAKSAPAAPSNNETPPIKEVFSNQGSGYGTAGCGLGGMLIGNKPGFTQVFAATVNGTGMQTFAVSSGTSGCGQGGNSASMFIENNREALAREASRGEGQTLAGLSRIMGCQDQTSFGQEVQKRYMQVFGEGAKASDAIRTDLETLVKTTPSCKARA